MSLELEKGGNDSLANPLGIEMYILGYRDKDSKEQRNPCLNTTSTLADNRVATYMMLMNY